MEGRRPGDSLQGKSSDRRQRPVLENHERPFYPQRDHPGCTHIIESLLCWLIELVMAQTEKSRAASEAELKVAFLETHAADWRKRFPL